MGWSHYAQEKADKELLTLNSILTKSLSSLKTRAIFRRPGRCSSTYPGAGLIHPRCQVQSKNTVSTGFHGNEAVTKRYTHQNWYFTLVLRGSITSSGPRSCGQDGFGLVDRAAERSLFSLWYCMPGLALTDVLHRPGFLTVSWALWAPAHLKVSHLMFPGVSFCLWPHPTWKVDLFQHLITQTDLSPAVSPPPLPICSSVHFLYGPCFLLSTSHGMKPISSGASLSLSLVLRVGLCIH